MNQTLTIRIPADLREGLQQLSSSQNKPVSDIVRDSLARTLAIHRFRQLRNATLPFAEAQGILTDEEVFDLIS